MYPHITRNISIILAFQLLIGCGLLLEEPTTPPSEAVEPVKRAITNEPSGVPVEKLEPRSAEQTSSIEVVWAMPEQVVDGFVIHYGTTREALDREVKVNTGDLEKVSDPDQGEVFRYIVRDVPPDKPIYVAISAFSGQNSSPMSDVREVSP